MKTEVEAEALALALQAGAVDAWDVQSWADSKVAAGAAPNPLLFEISARSDPAEILSVLNGFPAGNDKRLTARLAIGHLQRAVASGTCSHLEAAKLLERMVREGYIPDSGDEGVMWSLADEFELVLCGEYPPDLEVKLKEDFDAFVGRHAV